MSKPRAARSRSKEKEKHPAYLGTREIVFTNLLLLGFEPGDMESKYNIPFIKDMFALPNKKAFEVIMHFLFSRLNPVMSAEKFRFCWPITDKKQEQVFRRAISEWLQEISKEDPDAHLPRIVPSLFLSPGGDKFYTVLLYFTQYVVYKVIRGENGEKEREILRKPHLAPGVAPLSSVMLKSYQAATIRRQKQALEQTQVTVLVHKQWQQFISELVKDYRSLSKTVRDLERKVKDLYAQSFDQAQARGEVMTSRRRSGVRAKGEKELLAVKRAEKLRKVRELWKAVDGLMEAQAQEKEVVESILQEVAMKSKLDAEDFHVQVPELLLRECEAEIQRRSIANVYQGGKLSLLSLIQLWNLALKLYLEKIHQAPLASFDTIAPSVITQVHTHHAHLSNAQALRTNLAKDVDKLKTSIHELRHQTSMRTPGRSQGSLRAFQSSTFGLSLLPPTPPVSFEPANPSDKTPMRLHGMHASTFNETHPSIDTPEAVSQMSQAVDRAALRTSGLVQGTPSSMLKDLRQQIHGHSKLPVPTVDNTTSLSNRRRIRSAPSKVTSTASTPLSHHSRSKPAVAMSQRKQVTRVARTERKDDRDEKISRVRGEEPGNGVKGTHSGRKRHERTPLQRQTNNNASSSRRPPKSKTKPTPKAHQILVDQIADAVMSGDGVIDSISPLLFQSTHSHESPPVADSLNNPLAALDENAFVSRDKLARTPDHAASPAVPSSARNTLLQQATRNLFVTPQAKTQKVIPAGHETQVSNLYSQQHTFADKTEDDVRLHGSPSVPTQRTTQPGDISLSNLLDFSNTSLLLQDTLLSDESSDDIMRRISGQQPSVEIDNDHSSLYKSQQQHNFALSPSDVQSPVADPTQRSGTLQSPHVPSTPGNKTSAGGTPTGVPLEDFEQTLLEITRTKTPQLPTRVRQRVNHQRVMAPLREDTEDDLITSTERLSLSPFMNVDLDISPVHRDSSLGQSHDRVARTDNVRSDQFFETRTDGNILNEFSEWNTLGNGQTGQRTKTRQPSSGSQKSVTFSDHVDQHSFHDMSNVSTESHEESNKHEQRYDDEDEDFGIIDVHGGQAYEYIEVKTPDSNLVPTKRNTDSPPVEDNDAFISDTYLRHSPRSKDGKESTQSPLDSALQSGLDLSQVNSPDPEQRMQLLQHISPTISPSKTPILNTRKGVLSQGHLVSTTATDRSQDYHSRSSFNGFDQSSGYSDTPPVDADDFLVQGLSDLKLPGSLYRHTAPEKTHHTPRANLEFSGLLDEDDSILLSGSPLSRSMHQDGMDHVISPPPQNLIDI